MAISSAYQGQTIWIIGASSGIGKALAEALSAKGAMLILSARSKNKLEMLNAEMGGHHFVQPLDISDAKQAADVAGHMFQHHNIDRILLFAALYQPMQLDALDLAMTHKIIEVNLAGVFNVVHAVLQAMLGCRKVSPTALLKLQRLTLQKVYVPNVRIILILR